MGQGSETEALIAAVGRAMGTVCVLAIIVLSLLPGGARPNTGPPGQIEHSVAYFGTAVFLAFGFRTSRARLAAVALLVALAAALEVLQLWVPGRHSQFIDLFASSFGAGMGALVVAVTERVWATG
jgi:VanZ family protein